MVKRKSKTSEEKTETVLEESSSTTDTVDTETKPSDLQQQLIHIRHLLDKAKEKAMSYPYKQKYETLRQQFKSIDWKKIDPKRVNWNEVAQQANRAKEYVLQKDWRHMRVVTYMQQLRQWISDFWKIIFTVVPAFLLFYYTVGSLLVEDIDVRTGYKISDDAVPGFETGNTMSFLIKREIDAKMWTPNLPIIFPAYVLDNMPNFQTGVVAAVRDVASMMRKFSDITEQQRKEAQKAYSFLSYPPNIWLMSRKSTFNLAPSSNSQYRKAAKELRKFTAEGDFIPSVADLDKLLKKISGALLKLARLNEDYVQEKSAEWTDSEADDLFYYAKGYSFAMWQLCRTLGVDFKNIILENDLYTNWTYLTSSLKKSAELDPWIVRNGHLSSSFSPNHLMLQNYYLLRAAVAIERMRGVLPKETYDNKS